MIRLATLTATTALVLSCSFSYSGAPPRPAEAEAGKPARTEPEPARGKPARKVARGEPAAEPGAAPTRPTRPPTRAPALAADLVFHGGPILTMRVDRAGEPIVAEALAVDDGEIVAVGAMAEIQPLIQERTRTIDLAGKALLPGFIAAGAGLGAAAARVDQVQLGPPPVGTVRSITELQRVLRGEIKEAKRRPGEWVVGWNYDDSALRERRQPTRDDLDAVSTEHPIVVYHRSGRLAVVNTPALRRLRIDADTVDPGGGAIGRRPRSREPNGVLEDSAVVMVDRAVPRPADDELELRLLTIERDLARRGFTTVQDGPVGPAELAALRRLARGDEHVIDVVAHARVDGPDDARRLADERFGVWDHNLQLGGIELVLDGSLAAGAAFLSAPYTTPPPGKPRGWRGVAAMTPSDLQQILEIAVEQGWQVLARAEGDAAAELFIAAWERQLEERRVKGARPILLGAHVLRDEQLDRMVDAAILPAFASAELYYHGDYHRQVALGQARAVRLDPAGSARERGLAFALAGDAPATPLDPLLLLSAAVTRTTRGGEVLGPAERVPVFDGLRGLTSQAAYQRFAEADRGTLAVGRVADLVVVDRNPLSVRTGDLADLRVIATYKSGESIHAARPPR